ncbi:hypothetical protein H310_06770 [Aphanomyces invadans]|uniref:rRNA-processing protein EFG1 n=1 Tax=Aphanomyces invadans TaxID=157072 RepID=A0A024U420_9STRA|nr:hypothetical protein H310_06770 [Aphanomyces invadans]ETW01171.1 hypothetical protein H310_06770 [Aphanomyces invadans]|eukprot:XP_008870169.1 hypothetical protein H310_06770 [Aphanomyces invadans]
MGRPTAGTILRMKKAQVKPKKKNPSLKNKIRNLERFLKKDTLPDDVRRAKEEELKELQKQTEGKQEEDRSREITLKFKKVRFFDRRRLMRLLKKLKRQLDAPASSESDKDELEKQFEQAKEDMMYVYYYPKGERYINLFPDAKKPHSAEDLERQDKMKKAALKAFKSDDNRTAFDHYCFNDDEAPPAEDDTKKRKVGKDGKTTKRKNKRPKTSTAKVVMADLDGADDGSGGDDDFFL